MSIPIRKALNRGTKNAVQPASLPTTLTEELLEMTRGDLEPIIYKSRLETANREKERIYARYGYLIFLGPYK